MTEMFKKIVIYKPGGFDKLKIETSKIPEPDSNQVLVNCKFIGVNFADCIVRMGLYSSAKKFIGWPITPGFEFSGIVRGVGKSVDNFKVGDKVFGVSLFNAYSTHLIVNEDQIFKVPDKLTLAEAGGFPVIFLTAYYALYLSVHIYSRSNILVHSAAGGVGSALLQLCKLNGWKSIGVVGNSHKVEHAYKMGADYVIDKSSEKLWEKVNEYMPNGADVILDGNGSSTLKQGFKHLNDSGKMIIYGFHSFFSKGKGSTNPFKLLYNYFKIPRFNPVSSQNINKTVSTFNLSYLFNNNGILQNSMRQLLEYVEDEKIRMPAIKLYHFADVGLAHQDLQSGKTAGKLVLSTE